MRSTIRWAAALAAGLAVAPAAMTDVTEAGNKGPSSSATPYVTPTAPGVRTVSLLTVGDSVSSKLDGATTYRMIGIPDGMGAFDNGDGTFTMLANHELGSAVGAVRAHGAVGATVSAWIVDRETLRVHEGGDLIRTVMSWDFAQQKWAVGSAVAINRLCSGDLPAPSALFDPVSGKGTRARIFFSGEETNGGRAFGHVASGANAGVSFELPRLGREAFENILVSPFAQEKTVAVATDDTTPGQVYVYVGTKSATGNEVQKAGLANGTLYGILANATRTEDRTTACGFGKGASGPFTLLALADQSLSSAGTDAVSDGLGVTEFLRPEDGAWDPSNPSDFYFVTTDRFDQTKNSTGVQVGRSRLWRLRFTDIASPENGGLITLLLDGTEAHNMFDNLCVTRTGFVMLQEDPGNQSWTARLWRYSIAAETLTEVARHDTARFGSESQAATAPFSQDEEASGILDATDVLGTGWFLFCDQTHYNIGDTELAEGGQFLALYDPATAAAPAFDGGAVATPSLARVGQDVRFSAPATVPGGGSLAYAWTFGDGDVGTGSSVVHSYPAPGSYEAVCTVTDPASGRSAQATVEVVVSRDPLAISLQVVLNFLREDRDSLVLKGELPVPAGFDVSGESATVQIGGVSRSFTLDSKGRGAAPDGSFVLLVKSSGESVPAQRAKFTVTLKNASLLGGLSGYGLTNATAVNKTVRLPIRVLVDGLSFQTTAELAWTATVDKGGFAK